MPLKDPEARKAYWRTYHIEHAEQNRRRAAEWYEAHKHEPEVKARRKAYAKKWRTEKRDLHLASRRRRRLIAKTDPRKEALRKAANTRCYQKRTAALKAITVAAKAVGCKNCGERDESCLDFHHRDPARKEFTIGKAIQRVLKPERLRAEIAKCDVLCANCHLKHEAAIRPGWRKQTPSESSRDAARRAEKEDRWKPLIARAHADGCTTCAEKDPACLVFHHVDPGRKDFMVMAYRLRVLRGPIVEEMMKCVVLCQNCHRRVHAGSLALPPLDLDAYWLERLAY